MVRDDIPVLLNQRIRGIHRIERRIVGPRSEAHLETPRERWCCRGRRLAVTTAPPATGDESTAQQQKNNFQIFGLNHPVLFMRQQIALAGAIYPAGLLAIRNRIILQRQCQHLTPPIQQQPSRCTVVLFQTHGAERFQHNFGE